MINLKSIKNGLMKHSSWQDMYYDGRLESNQKYDEYTRQAVDLVDDWDKECDFNEYIVDNDEYDLALMSGKIKRIL